MDQSNLKNTYSYAQVSETRSRPDMASPSSHPKEDRPPTISASQPAPAVNFDSPSRASDKDSGVLKESHLEPGELSQTLASSTMDIKGNESTITNLPEQSHPPVAEDNPGTDMQTSMESSSIYSTGLDVDSNPTETDNEDGDSALGASIYSSTYSTRSSVYDYVEENGRTYHRFKQGKYHLPNDDVSSSF
jgi:hypothetical protein